MSIQRKLNERERMAYASIARLEQELEALAAQRDEGLAREAEAQRTIELYVKGEASLREENDALQRRLAEAVPDFIKLSP